MWHITNLELNCLVTHSTYLINILIIKRTGLSFVQGQFYGPFHSTVRTFEQNWCHQTCVKFLIWPTLYFTVAAEEMRGNGSRNTDRTSFADKGLSAWKGENEVVRYLACLSLSPGSSYLFYLCHTAKSTVLLRYFKCPSCFIEKSGDLKPLWNISASTNSIKFSRVTKMSQTYFTKCRFIYRQHLYKILLT
jgi:hypothetical protein